MKVHRFAVPLIAACCLAVIGCTSAPPDTSKSQIQQLQQQEQADQALIKQIQTELSELRKRRNEPCPNCPHQNVDQLADPAFSDASQKRQSLDDDSTVAGKLSPDGSEEIQLDLPGQEHMKNKAGVDSAGLCVFTSIEIAAHWMNVEELRGFQEKMTHEQGGGWPDKVDQIMKKYAPGVDYIQYSGTDPSIIKLALKTGRMVGVTYGYSPRYKSKISHMVDCVHLTDKWAAVLDNNYPGEDQYEWMSPEEFLNRWKNDGGGWAIVLLSGNPPPPIPVNNGERRGVSPPCAPPATAAAPATAVQAATVRRTANHAAAAAIVQNEPEAQAREMTTATSTTVPIRGGGTGHQSAGAATPTAPAMKSKPGHSSAASPGPCTQGHWDRAPSVHSQSPNVAI